MSPSAPHDHGAPHAHDHGPAHGRHHGHHHRPARADVPRALTIALGLNAAFLGVEVAGGIAFGSLALLADATHMAGDVAALVVALVAARLARRPASSRHTFGLQRAEILAAQANAAALIALALWIAVEAWDRLGDPTDIRGAGVTAVAAVGLGVNLASAAFLHRHRHHDINARAALWHMLSDALGSVAAMAGGIAALVWSNDSVDAIASLCVAVLIVIVAVRILGDTTRVLLESVPAHLDLERVTRAMGEHPEVRDVHHVHVWGLGTSSVALSAHVVLDERATLNQAQTVVAALRNRLHDAFGIDHATIEVESEECAPEHDCG